MKGRVVIFPYHEPVKCRKCNWETRIGIVVGNDGDELDEKVRRGEFLCPECFVATTVAQGDNPQDFILEALPTEDGGEK